MLLGLVGCRDPAEGDLDRCISFEAQKDLERAIAACSDAAYKDRTSKAGLLAVGKLGLLREQVRAKELWEQAEAAARQKTLERQAEAKRIAVGGWKSLPMPMDADGRVRYMTEVTTAYEGEPPLNRKKAIRLMEKMRLGIAKAAGVPVWQVTAKVGTTSGSIKVADGVLARVGNSEDDAIEVGACSEPFLGLALLGFESGELAAAGLRGLICLSTGCSGTFDLRPNRPDGGGVYGGASCIGMADLVARATH